MARTRARLGRARWGFAASFALCVAAAAILGAPAAANPPDPTRPDIELTVDAFIDRPFTWAIEKTADPAELTLAKGETATVNYTITVTPTEGTTSWSAAGDIIVYNKQADPVTVHSVTNEISGAGPATVTCKGDPFPRQLNSGAQIRCTFHAVLPDNSNRVSTATAAVDDTSFTVSAPVDFGAAIDNRIDHCVEVHDSMAGLLSEQICERKVNKTVTYSKVVGPYSQCGKHTVDNTAWAITNHTGTRVETTETVKITVPCPPPPDECKDDDDEDDDKGHKGKKKKKLAWLVAWWLDKHGKSGKGGKGGKGDDDECEEDDEDRCDKDYEHRKSGYGKPDDDECDDDEDDDRCDEDDKRRKSGYGKGDDDCDRDDDRCDSKLGHGKVGWLALLGKSWGKGDRDDDCKRDGKGRGKDDDD